MKIEITPKKAIKGLLMTIGAVAVLYVLYYIGIVIYVGYACVKGGC